MLIKRITKALRRQDWLAVLIELVLVIAGILIALQINDWNEALKSRVEQSQILKRLKNDLNLDKSSYTEKLNFYNEVIIEFRSKRDLIYKLDLSKEEILEIFPYSGAYIQDLNPRRTTFDEMVNTGKLYQLNNLELVNAINDYYQLLELYIYNDRQKRNEFRALFYGPALTEYWYWVAHPESEKYAIEFFSDSNRNSTAFKSLMQSAGWSVAITAQSIGQYETLIEANNKIINLIEAALIFEN